MWFCRVIYNSQRAPLDNLPGSPASLGNIRENEKEGKAKGEESGKGGGARYGGDDRRTKGRE